MFFKVNFFSTLLFEFYFKISVFHTFLMFWPPSYVREKSWNNSDFGPWPFSNQLKLISSDLKLLINKPWRMEFSNFIPEKIDNTKISTKFTRSQSPVFEYENLYFSVRPNPLFLGSAETEPWKITETEPNPNPNLRKYFWAFIW